MCCFKQFPGEPECFLQITNNIDTNIYFILQYNTPRRTITKQSAVFGKGVAKRLSFTRNVYNIAFNVLTSPTHDFICNHVLPSPKFYYFSVIQTPHGFTCVES